jgi:hypothetical protein
MKKCVVASLLVVGLATPALAAEKAYVTVDTVGNCSAIFGKPGTGKTVIGETGGYDSMDAAKKALDEVRNDEAKCKGVVE